MGFEAEILADSVADTVPYRLTTCRVRVPVFVHTQIIRYRMFSYSVASTRAIPLRRQIEAVEADPFLPVHWGKDRPGMQATEELSEEDRQFCIGRTETALQMAIAHVRTLERIGVHKQVAGRYLMPFAWSDMIITGVWPSYANYFTQRCGDAQPETRKIARMMACVYRESVPERLDPGRWHLPLAGESDLPSESIRLKVSVARCARVSYSARRAHPRDRDVALHDRLLADGHWSPAEHQARAPLPGEDVSRLQGNLTGWVQYRQTLCPNVYSDFDFSALGR